MQNTIFLRFTIEDLRIFDIDCLRETYWVEGRFIYYDTLNYNILSVLAWVNILVFSSSCYVSSREHFKFYNICFTKRLLWWNYWLIIRRCFVLIKVAQANLNFYFCFIFYIELSARLFYIISRTRVSSFCYYYFIP